MAHYHLKALDTGKSAIYCLGEVYGPAVMLAYGHGFISPDLRAHSEIAAFLTGERESLPEDAMPTEIIQGKSTAAEYHRYLSYTMAAIWRLTGVSWRSLEPLLAFMMGWCAIAVYGLMRLGMKRLLSFVLAVLFTTSPAMLFVLPNLRDFGKAPFLLTILLGLGWLLKTRPSTARTFVLAIALGILTGVGMGFRQDALTFMPLTIAVLVAVGIARYRTNLMRIFLPAVVYLVCFVMMAWPMLTRMDGGASPDHHIIQGFSSERLDNLGVYSPVYKPLLTGADEYVFSTVYDYGRRAVEPAMEHFNLDSPGAEKAGRKWLINMALHFPADLLLRGYASALRTLRYADAYPPAFQEPTKWHTFLYDAHRIVARHMLRWGPIYGISVLFLIASQNMGLALGLFISCLYLFGYVSLQCEHRHAFHLSFFVFWIFGFLIHHFFAGLRKLGQGKKPDKAVIKPMLFRMALFSACCALMLFLPLYVLRVYQNHKVQLLLEPYMTAPRELLPTTRNDRYGWSLFSLEAPAPDTDRSDLHSLCRCIAMLHDINIIPWNVRSRYMVAEFSPDADLSWLILKFETDNEKPNFTQRIRFPARPKSNEPMQIYFPAYEFLRPNLRPNIFSRRNHFAGIGIPEDQANKFLGLYEITDLSKCPFLFTLSVPRGKLPARLYHRIRFIIDPTYYYQSETAPITYMGMAEAEERFGRRENAVFLLRSMLPLSREPKNLQHVILKLIEIGELDVALTSILEIQDMADKPIQDMESITRCLSASFLAENNPQQSEKTLDYLEFINPEGQPELWLDLAYGYEQAGLNSNALEKYHYLVTKYPHYEPGITQASHFVRKHYGAAAQIDIWKQWLKETSNAPLLWLHLGDVLFMSKNKEGAAQAYATAYEYAPHNTEVIIQYVATHVLQLGQEKASHLIKQVIDLQPQYANMVEMQIEHAAKEFAEIGDNKTVEALYALAEEFAKEKGHVVLLRAEALIALEHYEEAKQLLIPLINSVFSEISAFQIYQIFREEKIPDEAVAFWREQAQLYPDNIHVSQYLKVTVNDYVQMLFDVGEYGKAACLLADFCGEQCQDPLQETYRLVASLTTSTEIESMERIRKHTEKHPGVRMVTVNGLMGVAEQFEAQQRLNEAYRVALTATKISPEQTRAWLVAGRIAETCGNLENAKGIYKQALENVSDTAAIATMIDVRLCVLGNLEERRGVWETLVGKFPENTVMRMRLAIALDDEGRNLEALSCFKAVADAYSAQSDFQIRYGGALAKSEHVEEGVARIVAAIESDPQWKGLAGDMAARAGDVQAARNQKKDATILYRLALRCLPENLAVTMKLGTICAAGGQTEDAGQAFRQIILSNPEMLVARQAAREWDVLLKQNVGSIKRTEAWKELHEILPNAMLPAEYYVLSLVDAKETNEAILVCEAMLTMTPQSSDLRLAYGVLLCRESRVDEGLQEIEIALSVESTISPEIIDLMAASAAGALMEQGQHAVAERLLHLSLVAQPDNQWHKVRLGEVLAAQERYGEALECFRQILTVAPESPHTAAQIDAIYDQYKTPEARVEEWTHLNNLHPESPVINEHLEKALE